MKQWRMPSNWFATSLLLTPRQKLYDARWLG
jgi:hypothetical protein